MTGQYPKIWGSVLAPLFAVLVVQRSSCGLCSGLKLGVLSRFSRLLDNKEQERLDDKSNDPNLQQERATALSLWHRIESIEYWGYLAGCFLLALVILDSRDFVLLHCVFATIAFACLYRQNSLVGYYLGLDFQELFPNWTNQRAVTVFRLGKFHLAIMYVGFLFFGTLTNRGRCDDLWDALSKLFGGLSRTNIQWLVSVLFWSNEYAFAFLWIYVQTLEHFEIELWEFAGAESMSYMSIISRFSVTRAILRLVGYNVSDADAFLGLPSRDHESVVTPEAQKVKYS